MKKTNEGIGADIGRKLTGKVSEFDQAKRLGVGGIERAISFVEMLIDAPDLYGDNPMLLDGLKNHRRDLINTYARPLRKLRR